MSNLQPGVSGAEPYFEDPMEVMAYDALDSLAAYAVDGYEIVVEAMPHIGGKVAAIRPHGQREYSAMVSVRRDVDHSRLIEALDKVHATGRAAHDGEVLATITADAPDDDAAWLLRCALADAVEGIRNHDDEESHPDV